MNGSFSLMNIMEGYVRNYRRLNIHESNNWSMITSREIGYFATVGEYLGYFTYMEDTKPNKEYGRSRPMDLSWWTWDERVSNIEFVKLALHLERENQTSKDIDTIDKLFCTTEEKFTPSHVIAIQNVVNRNRISELNREVEFRNKKQKSETLMIYQYYDKDSGFHRLEGHYFSSDGKRKESRNLISKLDMTGYWMMCFEEEYDKDK